MFNVGGGEFLVIALIALIVLGPTRLPDAARQAGKVMADLRRISNGFQSEIRTAFEDADRSPDPAPSSFPVVEPLGGQVGPDQMAGALAAVSSQSEPEPTAPAKKTPTKKSAAKTAPAKKTPAKKAPAKKAAAKKAPAKTTATKKAPAKKASAVSTARPRRSPT